MTWSTLIFKVIWPYPKTVPPALYPTWHTMCAFDQGLSFQTFFRSILFVGDTNPLSPPIPPALSYTVMPELGGPVKPIPTGECRLSPPITPAPPPNVFHHPASLVTIYWNIMFAFDRSTRAAEFRQAGEAYALIMVALPSRDHQQGINCALKLNDARSIYHL